MANAGYMALRELIAEQETAASAKAIQAGGVVMTVGAAGGLNVTLRALLDEGDEVILLTPYFPEYIPYVNHCGGKVIVVDCAPTDFMINFPALKEALNAKTKAIILNSPNNPSGVVYTRQTLEGLARLLERKSAEYGHPIYIIADEPYRELVYGGVEVPFIPTVYRNTIVCYSYSKSLSLPGERIGYICVPDFVEDHQAVYNAIAGAARSCGHVCPPTLIQLTIARCADETPDLAAYDENRQLLYRELTAMGYQCAKPDGAFYLFVKAPGGDDVAFCERAKREHNLLVVPGTGFECPGYVRLSYCVSNDMIRRSLPAFRELIAAYQS